MKKQRIIFRTFPFNISTYPVLLYQWEKHKIDTNFDIIIYDKDLSHLDVDKNDIVIYSFMTPHIPLINDEIASLKNKCILIAGGANVSSNIELSFEMGFNVLFVGAGENTFLQFGYDILNGDLGKKLKSNDNKITYIEDKLIDIDESYPISKYLPFYPFLEIARGCFWKCSYCQTGTVKVQFRSIQSIKKYLEILKNEGKNRLSFISPSAFEYFTTNNRKIDIEQMKYFFDLVKGYGFKMVEYGIFPSEIRPDTVTDELVSVLSKSITHKKLTIGCQSASAERLKMIKRGHSLESVVNAVKIFNKYGFKVNIDIILCYPCESKEERLENINFMKDLSKHHSVLFQLHHFFPLAGSDYHYKKPSFMDDSDREAFIELYKAGIATNWFLADENNALKYFQYMQTHFPSFYEKYR